MVAEAAFSTASRTSLGTRVLSPSCILVLSLSVRSLLMILGPEWLQESHVNMMTDYKNRVLLLLCTLFLLASKTFTRNFQAEFSLSPTDQAWVTDPCLCQGS